MANVNELIARLLRQSDLDALFGRTVTLDPVAELQNTYGAISSKVSSADVAERAVGLLEMARESANAANPEQRQFATTFANCVSSVATELSQSALSVAPSSVLAAFDTLRFSSAVTETSDAMKVRLSTAYTANAGAVIELLDVGLAISVSQVPLVGPIAAGYVMGGVGGAVAMGSSAAIVYMTNTGSLANTFGVPASKLTSLVTGTDAYQDWAAGQDPKQLATMQSAQEKALQGVAKDVTKDMMKANTAVQARDKKRDDARKAADKKAKVLIAQPKTHGIGLAWYYLMRTKLGWTNEGIGHAAQGDMNTLMSTSGVGNVMSLADNASINPQTRNQLCIASTDKFIDTGKFGDKAEGLKSHIKTNYDTLEGFSKKMVEVQKSLRALLEDVLKVSVVRSFRSDLKAYHFSAQTTPGFAQRHPDFYVTAQEVPSGRSNHTRVVALLIVAYFVERAWKNSQPYQQRDKAPSPLKALEAKGNDNAMAFKALQRGVNQVNLGGPLTQWKTIEDNSKAYVRILKSAIVDDLTAPFRYGATTPDDLKKALKLFMACSIIVNDNASRKAAGKQSGLKSLTVSTATDIPIDVIRVLQELDYLTIYSTMTGFVTDKDKKKYTAGGTKLRWFNRVGGGASASEKMMVYVFSCAVLSIVDVTKISCGFQSWSATEKLLRKIIQEINSAEMKMG